MDKRKVCKILWCNKCLLLVVISIFTLSILINSDNVISKEQNSYVALGDSIAFGTGAKSGKGYVELLYNYLKSRDKYSDLALSNLGNPGDTSSDLLEKLNKNDLVQQKIKNAEIITISIGGNNIISPVLDTFAEEFGVDKYKNANFDAALTKEIQKNPRSFEILNSLLTSGKISKALASGAASFNKDWISIVSRVKQLAPNAKIYVSTIYNPFDKTDIFYGLFDEALQAMNYSIEELSNNYILADSYNSFKNNNEKKLVEFDIKKGNLDPHPNEEGYRIIFQAHAGAVESVAINKGKDSISVGDSMQLLAVVAPIEANEKQVIWVSSDDTIAEVSNDGLVKAKKAGDVRITAKTLIGGKNAYCDIKVMKKTLFLSFWSWDNIITLASASVLFTGLVIITSSRRRRRNK